MGPHTKYDIDNKVHEGYILGDLSSKRLDKFFLLDKISNFVETGTYRGAGVHWALSKSFDSIITIEYAKALADRAAQLFEYEDSVCVRHGHSPDILAEIIPSLTTPTIFYLDAHETGGWGAEWKIDNPCPLVDEISTIISNFYDINELIIVLDDERVLNGLVEGYPNIDTLSEMLSKLGLTSCYLDDSAIFCAKKWFK